MQLNAPRVLEVNLDDGFLLLTDLGATQFLEKLQKDTESAQTLYVDALRARSKPGRVSPGRKGKKRVESGPSSVCFG